MLGRNASWKWTGFIVLLVAVFALASCEQSPADDEQDTTVNPTVVKEEPQKEAAPEADAPREEPKPEAQAPAEEPKEQPQAEAPAAGGDMEALPLELPKPMFVGTPQNIEGVDNLEKPRGKPRPPFFAPKGAQNLAVNKPVSGSDELPIMGELAMITDGDKEAADGSYVELGPFTQYVTIDLGAEHDIYAVLFWHFHKQARVYFDVVVQVAKDPDFIDAVTVYNNDLDNSAGLGIGEDMHYIETSEGRLVDAKGVQGRYVRLYSTGNSANDLNHYIEVEVWGK